MSDTTAVPRECAWCRQPIKSESAFYHDGGWFHCGCQPASREHPAAKLQSNLAAALARAEKWKGVAVGLRLYLYHSSNCKFLRTGSCTCGVEESVDAFDALVKEEESK